MTFDKQLGTWLKAKRVAKGMTQQQIADRMQIDRTMVHYWEKGQRNIYASDLVRLCDILDADLVEFIELRREKNARV